MPHSFDTVRPRWQLVGACLALIAVIGVGDSLTTAEGFFTLLYLAPVFLASSRLGRPLGLAAAGLCSLVSILAEKQWSSASAIGELGVFVAFALLISRLTEALAAERAKSAERLDRSRERFQNLADESPSMIFIIADGKVVYANRQCRETFGYGGEASLADIDFLRLVAPEDVDRVKANMQRKLAGETVPAFEYALLTLDGRRIHGIHTTKLIEHEGRPAILGTITDITERKRAEAQVSRLSRAVEQAADSIVITDETGKMLYVNPAFELTTGYTREEAVGENPRILKSGIQDAAFYAQMWDTLVRGDVWSGHLVNARKDGSLLEEDARISPVRDDSGKIVNYVAVKHDVTTEMQLQKQLMQAQRMEGIGRLAAGVAHDFNNLLGVIIGYGELADRAVDAASPLHGKLDQILKAAHRAAGLTRQLLAFSRQQVLAPKVMNLNAVLLDMDKMFKRLVGEDVEVATRTGEGLGNVRADPGQVEQIIMNLVVNARDAMPDGGQLTIETSNADLDSTYVGLHPPTQPGRYVKLTVTDTGCGMDAATQSHIFEPFFTTKGLGKGTGLGLSTTYGAVKQSGGFIWVYSEVGVGTSFKVYLPRVDEETQSEPVRSPPSLLQGGETVLLVEDDDLLRDLLAETLEIGGYRLLVAREGTEALRVAAAHAGPLDLLVTDVIMPGSNGRKVAAEVLLARPGVKVLYISGYAGETISRSGVLDAGFALLEKPFGPNEFLRRVREVLGDQVT